jgi:hypothetical protein
MSVSLPPRRRRRPAPAFRPRSLLVLLYVFGFTVLFALAIALPALLEGARDLGPGPAQLAPEEMERAREIARGALSRARLVAALALAIATVGAGIWRRILPGFR